MTRIIILCKYTGCREKVVSKRFYTYKQVLVLTVLNLNNGYLKDMYLEIGPLPVFS